MTYILVWNGVNGRVLANGEIIFDVDSKPVIGFDYDTITLDTNLQVASYTKKIPNVDTMMVSELDALQLDLCKQYCDSFLNSQDYEVHAYNDEKIYVGPMLKSKAEEHQLGYSIAKNPIVNSSKWDDFTQDWAPVYAAFKEDGYPDMNPVILTDNYVLVMTKSEWDKLPERPSVVYSLDIPTMTWKDKRELSRVKHDAIMDIRVYYEHASLREQSYIRPQEMSSWLIQRSEANAYLKDEKSITPFLDGFLSTNSQLNKKELCERILEDYTQEKQYNQGVQHGEMYSFIYRIKEAITNQQVDEIVQEVYQKIGKYRVLNIYQKYPSIEKSKTMEAELKADTTEELVFSNGRLYHARPKS